MNTTFPLGKMYTVLIVATATIIYYQASALSFSYNQHIFYRPHTKHGARYCFHSCLSFCPQGVWCTGVSAQRGLSTWDGCLPKASVHSPPPPHHRDCYCWWQYASYMECILVHELARCRCSFERYVFKTVPVITIRKVVSIVVRRKDNKGWFFQLKRVVYSEKLQGAYQLVVY